MKVNINSLDTLDKLVNLRKFAWDMLQSPRPDLKLTKEHKDKLIKTVREIDSLFLDLFDLEKIMFEPDIKSIKQDEILDNKKDLTKDSIIKISLEDMVNQPGIATRTALETGQSISLTTSDGKEVGTMFVPSDKDVLTEETKVSNEIKQTKKRGGFRKAEEI